MNFLVPIIIVLIVGVIVISRNLYVSRIIKFLGYNNLKNSKYISADSLILFTNECLKKCHEKGIHKYDYINWDFINNKNISILKKQYIIFILSYVIPLLLSIFNMFYSSKYDRFFLGINPIFYLFIFIFLLIILIIKNFKILKILYVNSEMSKYYFN